MKAFIRTEHGNSYVYKDNNGTLKKQQVTVGSIDEISGYLCSCNIWSEIG